MSNEKVAVKFTKSWRGYSAGEVACFGEVAAGDLVKGKVAELVKAGKAPDKPAASAPTGKGGGKGKGSGKGGSGEAAPEPGAPVDTPPAPDTPPADEEPGDDDEPKP
ncbi:hypothetical protein N5D41_13260 [Pseudomonas toyotomiensis]|uniref:Uncharacterized protein n=1 Tax=Ectopseudomonas toyotomiensis TaxID=554344 RepID=A0AA42ITL7_9GAMM|nr:hypothetical protein [Pseudomonas toyotomiensis]MDH0702449.1 hypothetical protein [Pseudomonas toyotomiensis]